MPGTAEADYHELESAGDMILAVSVESPDILVSRDGGQTWEKRTPPQAPIDVVVDPDDPQQWAVSTEQGTFVSTDGGGSWRPRDTTFGARLTWPAATRSTASTATARCAQPRRRRAAGRTAATSAASRA